MSDIDKQKLNKEVLPFFVRYLEEQDCQELSEEESTSVRGGYSIGKVTTYKYPSDNEDAGGGDGVFTTLKYPSDNEDVGGGDGVFTTLKYPSDNEDVYSFTFR